MCRIVQPEREQQEKTWKKRGRIRLPGQASHAGSEQDRSAAAGRALRLCGRGVDSGGSAQTGEGISHLLELMDRALTADPIVEESSWCRKGKGRVSGTRCGRFNFKREFSGDLVDLAVAGPASLLARYRQYRHGQTGPKAGTGRGSGSGAISHGPAPLTLIRVKEITKVYALGAHATKGKCAGRR